MTDDILKPIYDKKKREITLGPDELLEHDERYVVLTPWQAIVVKAIKKATSRFKRSITAADLVLQDDIQTCSQMIIRNILKSLIKKRIVEKKEVTIRDLGTVDVFKLK